MLPRPVKPLSAYGYLPGEKRVYCYDCRESAPMAPRSSRCEACATRLQELEATYKMPEPIYRGHPSSYTIGHILGGEWKKEHAGPLSDGERRLGWFVLPPFQRAPVWTSEQKIRLIESIWLELPIGNYTYVSTDTYKHRCDNWLIDGQQRITAILEYVAGEFPVFGYRFSELAQPERFRFENTVFPAIVVRDEDPERLREIYDRLAYGGTPHDPR